MVGVVHFGEPVGDGELLAVQSQACRLVLRRETQARAEVEQDVGGLRDDQLSGLEVGRRKGWRRFASCGPSFAIRPGSSPPHPQGPAARTRRGPGSRASSTARSAWSERYMRARRRGHAVCTTSLMAETGSESMVSCDTCGLVQAVEPLVPGHGRGMHPLRLVHHRAALERQPARDRGAFARGADPLRAGKHLSDDEDVPARRVFREHGVGRDQIC